MKNPQEKAIEAVAKKLCNIDFEDELVGGLWRNYSDHAETLISTYLDAVGDGWCFDMSKAPKDLPLIELWHPGQSSEWTQRGFYHWSEDMGIWIIQGRAASSRGCEPKAWRVPTPLPSPPQGDGT